VQRRGLHRLCCSVHSKRGRSTGSASQVRRCANRFECFFLRIPVKVRVLFRPEWPVHVDTCAAERYRAIADDIHRQGWSDQPHFLSPALTRALEAECRTLAHAGALSAAEVGRAATRACRPDVRGDRICWITAQQSAACDAWLAQIHALRLVLNRELCAGLGDYEGHFAWFAPGTAYARHRDQFRNDDSRIMTVVAYLNDRWQPEHGGALRLHGDGRDRGDASGVHDIAPAAGRVVVFLSADIEHEVMLTTRNRLSITGWFTRRRM
jgi:SM-20-related protein